MIGVTPTGNLATAATSRAHAGCVGASELRFGPDPWSTSCGPSVACFLSSQCDPSIYSGAPCASVSWTSCECPFLYKAFFFCGTCHRPVGASFFFACRFFSGLTCLRHLYRLVCKKKKRRASELSAMEAEIPLPRVGRRSAN